MIAMASTRSKDLKTLQAMGEQGQFAIELREVLEQWKERQAKQTGRPKWNIANAEFAEAIGVATGTLSRYLNAIQTPDYATAKQIGRIIGPSEEYWLELARRPNFPQFIAHIQQDVNFRHQQDSAFILKLLSQTGTMAWRESRSFWKERAEIMLQDVWGMRDNYKAARAVAECIYAWTLDKQRETPFSERQPITV